MDPAVVAEGDTSSLANDTEMPILSKTPPTERAPKSATGSRTCHSSARAGGAILPPGILDQLQDAVFTTDLHGIITSCNQGVDRYGYAPKDLIGRNRSEEHTS